MCLRTWSKNVSKWQVQVGKRLRLELFWGCFEAKRRCQSHKLGLHMQRDNPVTHSTCRCLRAQGIPWERKQTLLHWVLHCYKEITAKAFSFETPISNVMFYRKKSDFFFFFFYIPSRVSERLCSFFKIFVLVMWTQTSSRNPFFYEGQHKYGKESLSFLQRRKIEGAGIEDGAATLWHTCNSV